MAKTVKLLEVCNKNKPGCTAGIKCSCPLYDRELADIELVDDIEEVYVLDGLYHRTDGPAIVYTSDGYNLNLSGQYTYHEWFVNGTKCYSLNDFIKMSKTTKEDAVVLKLKYGGDF